MSGMAATRSRSRLDPNNVALLVCDMQEKFAPVIEHFDGIVTNTNRLGEKLGLVIVVL